MNHSDDTISKYKMQIFYTKKNNPLYYVIKWAIFMSILFSYFLVYVFVNVATAYLLADMVRVHIPVPVQSPLHPVKTVPIADTGVSTICVPEAIFADVPTIPDTTPVPVPAMAVVRAYVSGTVRGRGDRTDTNVATIFLFEFMVTVHIPVPVQSPLHPVNVNPGVGTAASNTFVPDV